MPSIVRCRCGASFQAADFLAGKSVACPRCGTSLAVPAAGEAGPALDAAAKGPLHVRCQACGGGFAARPQLAGHLVLCPRCGSKMQVAGSAEPQPPAPDDPLFAEDLRGADTGRRLLPTSLPTPTRQTRAKKSPRTPRDPDQADARRAGIWFGGGLVVVGIGIMAWAAYLWDGSLAASQRVGTAMTAILLGGILAAFFALGGRIR